jgi:hypothetical protein
VDESLSLFGNRPAVRRYADQRVPGQKVCLVDPTKFAQKNFWLDSVPVVVAANGTGIATLTPPRDQGDQGDTEVYQLKATSTGTFSIRMYAEILDRRLMNIPVESSLIFGNGNFPGQLLETLYVPATSSIRCELSDLSTAQNKITLMGHGLQVLNTVANLGRSREDLITANAKVNTHAYWLTHDSGSQVTIPAGVGTGLLTVQAIVPSDADFNCWQILSRSDQGANSFDIEIVEGQRRSLMRNGPVPIELVGAQTLAIAGSPGGIFPAASASEAFWPDTHLFQRNTIIQFNLVNQSANDNVVSIALGGQLIYYQRATGGMAAGR